MRGKTTIAAQRPSWARSPGAGVRGRLEVRRRRRSRPGQIIVCTDATYPPEESSPRARRSRSARTSTSPRPSATQIGLKANIKNTTFDWIIAALKAGKCDVVIAA